MPEANSYINALSAYQPGMPIEQLAREHGFDPTDVIKLASNENPLGANPKALEAFAQAASSSHRYPEHHKLVEVLANFYDIDDRWLVIGNGSNDIIDLVARTYLNDGDEAVMSQYAFAMYHIAVRSVGATSVTVPAKDYGHDLDAMAAAITSATRVVWIANPNNPTGTFIPYEDIKRFLEKVPAEVIVVLDEAYYEYLHPDDREDTYAWVLDHPNLVVLRTFSKIYGLAGMRVGYGVASKEVAELLNRVRLPFNVSGPSIAAATAALQDTHFVQRGYELNEEGRKVLLDGLGALGYECMPAFGNFVTYRVPDGKQVYEKLLAKGVIVRPLAPYGLANWLRVTIGLPAENEKFLQALGTIRAAA